MFDSNHLLFGRREVLGHFPPSQWELAEEWILALTVNIKGRGVNQLLINFLQEYFRFISFFFSLIL